MTRHSTLEHLSDRWPDAGGDPPTPDGRMATVIAFRARPCHPEPIRWHEAHRFERGARYRELTGGRTGYFIGASEVPALGAAGWSVEVLLFRDPETGVMWVYTEAEAEAGTAYEQVPWDAR